MASPLWNRAQSLIFGSAIGAAASRAVEAALEPARQHAWKQNQVRVLDPGSVAELVARGFAAIGDVADEAARNGYSSNRLAALAALRQSYPSRGELDALSNRNLITPEQLERVLSRHGLGKEWHEPIKALFSDLLSPDVVANAVQQGHLPNHGVLPDAAIHSPKPAGYVTPTSPDGAPPSEVPLTQIPLDPIHEAAGAGIDEDRLKVLANLAGLPPPQGELRDMLNRGIIDESTFTSGIREGHTKTKWIEAVMRLRWSVISSREYAEAWLRSWITREEAYAGGALTGYTPEQMDLLYRNRGRPATPRQLWLGWARKVKAPDYPDQPANGRLTGFEDHELAIARSNIRPEYAPLLWEIRYNYPSLFQLNNLVRAGAVDPDTAALWAGYNLEAPEVVDALKVYWQSIYPGAGGSSAAATPPPEIKSARTKLLTTLHKAYVTYGADDASVIASLEAEHYPPETIDGLLEVWGNERAFVQGQGAPPEGPKT